MAVAENSQGKVSHKLVLLSIKALPILLAVLSLGTTVLDYCTVDTTVINYLILGSLIAFMYLVSHVFKFCVYHRMFLHYFVGMNLISVYDTYVGIPVDNYQLFQLYMAFTGVCLIIILCLHVKNHKRPSTEGNR